MAFGKPSIGGRYSVLSDFGMVPAALMGIDIKSLLSSAQLMVRSCGPNVPPAENPGVMLGVIMAQLAKAGRDKVTLIASPGIADFGAWLEQLLAESTGKLGKGLIPVDAEPLGPPNVYGKDRLFAYIRLTGAPDVAQDKAISNLERAGHPVVRIAVADRYHIGQEFFRWEFATAVAGSILGINPFDQPDVEASKVKTRELTAAYEKTGKLPAETPLFDATVFRCSPARRTRRHWQNPAARWPRVCGRISVGCAPATTADSSHTSSATSSIPTHCRRSASLCGIESGWRPASALGRVSCIQRVRPTKAARTPVYSCKSPAMTPAI